MAKSKLEYWTGSVWTEAQTITSQNALVRLELEDSLNNAMKANITLGNAALEPFKEGIEEHADRYGPLTSVFTDFMPIRIIETDTNVILFHGRVYDIKNIYDKARGNVVQLYARDHLAELADYPTDGKDSEIRVGAATAPEILNRSTLIKHIIRDEGTDALVSPQRSSLQISSGNIVFDDALKFTASGRAFSVDGHLDSYKINTLGRQGLKAIYEIAKNDPHETSGAASGYGYDFYSDSQFFYNTATPPVTATNPAADFNYFKRGTRPSAFTSIAINFKGLWVEYPIGASLTGEGRRETGNTTLMMSDYDFNLPKRDLYTGATAQISRNIVTNANTDNEETIATNFNLEFEILDVTLISGEFDWKNRLLNRWNLAEPDDTNIAEELKRQGTSTIVGRIQYQSTIAANASGYVLISFEPDYITNHNLATQKKNFNALAGTVVLEGVESGKTFTLDASTGRPSALFGLSRPLRISTNDSKHVDSMRRRIASALSRSKTTRTECSVRTLPPPFFYIDTTVSSETGAGVSAVPTLAIDAEAYGFRNGMTIAKIDSDGEQTAHGYATLVDGTAVTAPLNTGNWDNYTGSVRLYFPVRAGHYIYAKNLLADFKGYMMVKSAVYSEEPGMQATLYKGTGVNATGSTIGLGVDPNSIQASIEGEGNKYPKDSNVPISTLGWTYEKIDSTRNARFTMVSRSVISWAGGKLVIGGGGQSYEVAAGSVTLSTVADPMGTGLPTMYKLVFTNPNEQTPDSSGRYAFSFILVSSYKPNNNDIVMGNARAAKTVAGKALVLFDSSGLGLVGGIDAAGEDQFSAALFKKSLQPWTTDVSLYPGKHHTAFGTVYAVGTASQSGTTVTGSGTTWIAGMIGDEFKFNGGGGGGIITARASNTSITVSINEDVSSGTYKINLTFTPDNLNQYIHATNGLVGTAVNGTISFADNTTVPLNYNDGSTTTSARPTLSLGTVNSAVYYIFFKLADGSYTETADFTAVTQAIVDKTTTYSDATSDSRGLLAICSTGANAVTTSPYDEVAIQAFHGKGQNITADTIAANAITAGAIKAGTIVAADISAGTITTTQIAAGTIVAGDIAAGTITTTQIAAGTIVAGDIAAGTITTTQIAAGTIVAGDIAADTITSTQIAAGTIVAGDIAADTITSTQIAAGTITSTQIEAGTIVAADIATGTLNAFEIVGGDIRTAANIGESSAGAGIKISSTGIEGFSGGTTRVFFLDPASGTVTVGGGIDGDDGATGAQGATGNTGATGSTGSAGSDANVPNWVPDDINGAQITINGFVYSGSKSTFYNAGTTNLNTTAGWFLGFDANFGVNSPLGGSRKAVFAIGSGANYMTWNGSVLKVVGRIEADSNSTIAATVLENHGAHGTNKLQGVDGDVGTPGYSFSGDTSTGMYRSGSNVRFSAGGSLEFSVGTAAVDCYDQLGIADVPGVGSGAEDLQIEGGYLRKVISTKRSKMDITKLKLDSSKLYDLQPKSFRFRKDKRTEEGKIIRDEDGLPIYTDEPAGDVTFGLIAEEVNELFPNLVAKDSKNLPSSVNYSLLSVLLVEEIKKLKTRIEKLEGD